jgi:hypothetical protein
VKLNEISPTGAWIAAAVLFAVYFTVNYRLYGMPDAFSISLGGVIGSYLFAWIIWRVVKLSAGPRAPQGRFIIVVIASISVALQIFQHVSG